MSKRSGIIKNSTTALLSEIITLAGGFVLTRCILGTYGSEINGLIASITNFMAFISLCELGVGAVVRSNLYAPLYEKDYVNISRIIKSSKKFYRTIAYILVVYVAILAFIYPYIATSSFDNTYIVMMIIVLSINTFAQYYFGISYNLLLYADGKNYIVNGINIITIIANVLVSMLLISLKSDILIVKLSTAFIFLIRPIAISIYVKKKYKIENSIVLTEEPIKQKWNGLAQHIAYVVQNYTDTIVLTVFASVALVSVYNVYYMICSGLFMVVNSLTSGYPPILGKLLVGDDKGSLQRTFLSYEWIVHTLTTILFTTCSMVILDFIIIYTQGVTDVNYKNSVFAILICIALALRTIQLPYINITQVANHFKQTQKASVIEAVLNVIISVFTVKSFGLVGVTVGTIASLFYRLLYLVIYNSNNILKRNTWVFIRQLLTDIATCLLSIPLIKLCVDNADNYTEWIFKSLLVGLMVLAVSFCINLIMYRSETMLFFKSISSRVKRKNG